MNFKNILREIEKSDPEVYERLSDRRHILKSFGAKVAVAALPIAIGSMFKKAYGKTAAASDVINALNFALQLEYFEFNFYHQANHTGGLIPAADQGGFVAIEGHELAHIRFLNNVVTTLGGVPYTPSGYPGPNSTIPEYIPYGVYNFTAGTTYHTFSDYPTFLMLAEVFEDTGVRAYQGAVPTLIGSTVLGQAMQIASTEGRHAAHVRLLRRNAPISAVEKPAPWITNNIPPAAQFQPFYNGEENTTQIGGVDISSLPDSYSSSGMVPTLSATAAFDEGNDSGTILSLMQPFLY